MASGWGSVTARDLAMGAVTRASAQWWPFAVVLAGVVQYSLLFPIRGTRAITPDAATFLYGGGLLAEGYAPYLHWWDVKPPLIYDVGALLALVFPRDPWAQFYAGSLLTAVMSLTIVALVGLVVYRVTADNTAAFTAGVVLVGWWWLFRFPTQGMFPRFFAVAIGLLALLASLDGRHILAAVAGAAAAGFWQFGLIFPGIAFARAWTHDRHALGRMTAAAMATAAIVVAPIVLLGGGPAMVAQTVVAPILMGDRVQTFGMRITKFIQAMPLLWPALLGGVVAGFEHVARTRRHHWLAAGLGWALLQLGILDFDTVIDAVVLVVFAAIAVGIFVGELRTHLSTRQALVVAGCIWLIAGAGVYTTFYTDSSQYYLAPHPNEPNQHDMAEVEIFLDQEFPPDTCVATRWWYSHQMNERGSVTRPTPQQCPSVGPTVG